MAPTRRLDRNITGVLVFVALNFGYGFLVAGVSWESHLGGLITGFVLGCAGLLGPQRSRTLVFTVTSVGLVVLMAAAGAWKMVGLGL